MRKCAILRRELSFGSEVELHYSSHYKRKISALENEVSRLESRVCEEQAVNAELFNRLKNLERDFRSCVEEVKQLREETFSLRSELRHAEVRHEELSKELERKKELERAFGEIQKRNKELEKKLNIRHGDEEVFGLSTPSSKKVFKGNATQENQSKKGGGNPGHEGHGREVFGEEEADRTELNEEEPLRCDCMEEAKWERMGSAKSFSYSFCPMKLEKVMVENALWRCVECGRVVRSRNPNRRKNGLYDNRAIAHFLTECYYHNTPVGQFIRRIGVNRGTFFNLAHPVADKAENLFTRILSDACSEKLLHADETGTRMDGTNAYIWLIANERFKIFLHRKSRSGEEIRSVFGQGKRNMVLVTDRYAGYNKVNVLHQYCYVHLLRDIKKEKEAFPEEPEVQCFCPKLSALLKKAIGMFGSGVRLSSYRKRALKIKEQIMEICRHPAQHPAVQSLQNIFREKEDGLFQWIRSPDIPCENNYAERALRPLVITRKISYGSQSVRGMKTREILTTVLHTAAARGLEPAAFLEAFLNNPENASLLFS